MSSDTILEIRFTGGGILPKSIRAGEMAEVLSSFEDMLSSLVMVDHPKLTKDDLIVGLINIQGGSVRLQFSSQLPEAVIPAFLQISKSVKEQKFNMLPSNTIKSLQTFSSFLHKKGCSADFVTINGRVKVLATMTPDVEIAPVEYIGGDTTIYGEVIRVGGREPKAMVETVDGTTVYCDIANEDLAREVGEHLYLMTKLDGTAKWDARSLNLEEFKITKVSEFGRIGIVETFGELSKLVGQYYADVTDVESYIASIREQNEEI
jgi:hypothetical protein